MHEDNPYLLPDRVYTVLKWLGLIALPAIAWCINVIAPAWGLPYADQIVTTVNAVGTLIGILIGASVIKASKSQDTESCFSRYKHLSPCSPRWRVGAIFVFL